MMSTFCEYVVAYTSLTNADNIALKFMFLFMEKLNLSLYFIELS